MLSRSCAMACALLLLGLPGAARSQLVEDGAYLGGTFNAGFENFSNPGVFDFDEALGAGIRLGSRVHPLVAIETQYEWTGDFEADAAGAEIELDLHVITANGKLFLFPGRFEPFLMAGVGYGRADLEARGTLQGSADADGFVMRMGAGAQLGLHEALSLALEGGFVLPTGDLSDLPYFTLSAGLNLHFRGL
jgi:opacity protein-like surface antigen